MRSFAGCGFAALLFFVATSSAQTITGLDQLPPAIKTLNPAQPHPPLACTAVRIDPTLDFNFRFEAGYTLRVPLNLYSGAGHHWYVLLRVTPQAGARQPVYFTDTIDVPAPSDILSAVRGLFLLGEGRYDVALSLLDDLGRICRQSWTLDAARPKEDRDKQLSLPPGTVAAFSPPPPPDVPPARPRRITVLVSALPAAPRFVRPGKPDGVTWLLTQWGKLLDMTSSLLERNSSASVRMVVFSLGTERESFRQDGFSLRDMNRLVHAADVLDEPPVPDVLKERAAAIWQVLAGLITRETHAEPPSDDVIFIGTPMGLMQKIPSDLPGPRTESPQRYFYLQYRPNPRPGLSMDVWQGLPLDARTPSLPPAMMIPATGGDLPAMGPAQPLDCVADCVRRLNGKIFTIYTAADFAKAIRAIERSAGR